MRVITVKEKARYLADSVFSASDGIVTTFAIVAGSAGASLDNGVVLILGLANLLADGISMGAGNYLRKKSEIQYETAEGGDAKSGGSPVKHGVFTFTAFVLAGLVPLAPFVFDASNPFVAATFLVGITLFLVGFLKSTFTKVNIFKSGLEMFSVGGFAAFVAFAVGYLLKGLV